MRQENRRLTGRDIIRPAIRAFTLLVGIVVTAPSHACDDELPPGILYEQEPGFPGFGVVSQDFTDLGYSYRALDDFVVPDGHRWHVESLEAAGFYMAGTAGTPTKYGPYLGHTGPSSPTCPIAYEFSIHPDVGGAPDCDSPLYFFSTPGPDSDVDRIFVAAARGRLHYRLDSPATLPAGRYWFSARVVMPHAGCGRWIWAGTDEPQSLGEVPRFEGPDDPCVPLDTVDLDGPQFDIDLAFSVFGTDVTACSLRAGNVGTGDCSPPENVLFVANSPGNACREVKVNANTLVRIDLAKPTSMPNTAHYAMWIFDGVPGLGDSSDIYICGGEGPLFIGHGARTLPSNNTCEPGSVPCPLSFPRGRTSRSFGAGSAATLCLNPQQALAKAPTFFLQSFPVGDYVIGAVIQDNDAPASPQKNAALANWVVVRAR